MGICRIGFYGALAKGGFMRKPSKTARKRAKKVGLAHWSTNPGKPVLQRLARQLRRRGWSNAAIAVELGIERRTVAHYLSRRIAWPKRRKRAAAAATTACVKSEDSAGCSLEIMGEPKQINDLGD
jgi:hypothetical protein